MGVCLSLKSIKFNVKEESSIMKADETKRKREILLGINPCIYGLNYHDPAVVVLIDGRVVFGVEEERCNRVKHSKGVFPSLALAECLTYCNLTWDDIDAVVGTCVGDGKCTGLFEHIISPEIALRFMQVFLGAGVGVGIVIGIENITLGCPALEVVFVRYEQTVLDLES